MRTLKLVIAYKGTRYAGWQAQGRNNQHTTGNRQQPTIQGTIEQVLGRIVQERVRVVGSGRTDAGAHALGQVAHVKTSSPLSCERLLRSTNQLLPDDIALMEVEDAPATFHARFGARSKHYRYQLVTAPAVSPFQRPYVVHVRSRLDVALMRREAAMLKGRHDFRAFARVSRPYKNTVRTIREITLRRSGSRLTIDVEGDGFLHTMVRSIVGTLVDIGRGRLPPGTVRRLLRMGDRRLAGTTAPAKGLTLIGVSYGSGT